MRLELSSWPEVEAYLARCKAIIVPLGSTEQHGPNGLIGTDALCAQSVAFRAGETGGYLVAPVIAYGVAPFNLGFPGTISLRARTFSMLILDTLRSLQRHGFTHIYCLNGHGGNIAPTQSAFADFYADTSLTAQTARPPRCRLVSWWQYPRTNELRQTLYGDREGMHATPSEVAMTRFTHPVPAHANPMTELSPLPGAVAKRLAGDAHYDATHHRETYPDGRVGSAPDLARKEHGEQLLSLAGEEAAADIAAFMTEP